MGQSTSISIAAKRDSTWKNEFKTRRLRYKRFIEDADWCSNPPDGLDVMHDTYKPSYVSREMLDKYKAFPKHLFPESFSLKKKSIVEGKDEKIGKQSVLNKIRRNLLEEATAERKLTNDIYKTSYMLANLERKWPLKGLKVDTQQPETLSGGILEAPAWFTRLRKEVKDVFKFSDLVQSPFPDTKNSAIENMCAKKLKLVLKQRKSEGKMFFKLSEKVPEGKSWKTRFTVDDVYITKANAYRLCLSGEYGLDGEKVTFDIMIINTNNKYCKSNLKGIYVKQLENDPILLTWIAKSK